MKEGLLRTKTEVILTRICIFCRDISLVLTKMEGFRSGSRVFIALLVVAVGINAENATTGFPPAVTTPTAATKTTPQPTATTQNPITTTLTPAEMCAQFNNKTCNECLGVPGAKCLWCNSDKSCQLYPLKKVLPSKEMCALDEARWGVCWLNFEALIIGVSVTGGIIILALTICICRCCCCRGNNKRKYDKEDARFNAQKMERKAKSDERKMERKERLDEIRRKYGLMKDEPYQRFDA